MIHRTLGTIAIEHLNAQSEFHKGCLHRAKGLNRWLREQYFSVEVTFDRHPNKIMRAGVACFNDNSRLRRPEIDKHYIVSIRATASQHQP